MVKETPVRVALAVVTASEDWWRMTFVVPAATLEAETCDPLSARAMEGVGDNGAEPVNELVVILKFPEFVVEL